MKKIEIAVGMLNKIHGYIYMAATVTTTTDRQNVVNVQTLIRGLFLFLRLWEPDWLNDDNILKINQTNQLIFFPLVIRPNVRINTNQLLLLQILPFWISENTVRYVDAIATIAADGAEIPKRQWQFK